MISYYFLLYQWSMSFDEIIFVIIKKIDVFTFFIFFCFWNLIWDSAWLQTYDRSNNNNKNTSWTNQFSDGKKHMKSFLWTT